MKTFLKGKEKLSHLINPKMRKDHLRFSAWDEADSMIMSWLWNSMQLEISGPYMILTATREIREVVRQTYSKVHDEVEIYEIKTKITTTKQGTSSMIEYYNIMKGSSLELDNY